MYMPRDFYSNLHFPQRDKIISQRPRKTSQFVIRENTAKTILYLQRASLVADKEWY